MTKDLSQQEVASWLSERDDFLILTHIRPDGDTLGCAGALAQSLREFGKTAYLLYNSEVTPRYKSYVDDYWSPDDFSPQFVIVVDTATTELLPDNALKYLDRISLCIDHHDSNTKYAPLVCCRSDYAACGEIIFEIVEIMRKSLNSGGKTVTGHMSKKTADCLYVAVSTDTGCFCYRNTTANTHKVAARLIECGAASVDINKQLFRTKRRERIVIEGMVNSGIKFFFGGKVAMVTITREMMNKSGATEDDIDDISNIVSSIEGVGIGVTIRELTSRNDCKISVRSAPPYSASELCKKLGGGGHKAAAGATVNKSADETEKDILSILEGYEF